MRRRKWTTERPYKYMTHFSIFTLFRVRFFSFALAHNTKQARLRPNLPLCCYSPFFVAFWSWRGRSRFKHGIRFGSDNVSRRTFPNKRPETSGQDSSRFSQKALTSASHIPTEMPYCGCVPDSSVIWSAIVSERAYGRWVVYVVVNRAVLPGHAYTQATHIRARVTAH